MKKYLCIGGNIRSKTDDDIHYISAGKLPELYQVNPQDCYFASTDKTITILRNIAGFRTEGLIILRPRSDGDYSLKGA